MKACQTCLQLIGDEKRIYHLTDIYFDGEESHVDTTSIKEQLLDCIPELLLDDVVGAVLCQSCVSSITAAYKFKQKCLDVQYKIHGYLQQMPMDTEITVTEIALHYKRLEIVASGGDPTKIDIGTPICSETLESPLETIVNGDEIKSTSSDEFMPKWLSVNLVNRFKYSCDVCDFSCKPFSIFCFHMIAHDNVSNKCNQCEFTSESRHLLENHMKDHMKEKRLYMCTLCEKRSNIRQEMVKHSFVHDQAFQCHVCNWKFPNKIELAMHMKEHQIYKTMNCEFCPYQCYVEDRFHKHMKEHGSKLQKCPQCNFKTFKLKSMKQHMIKKHKQVDEVSLKNLFGPNSWGKCLPLPGTSARQH